MTQKSIKELEAERERLIKELERAKLENRFPNTMIDIAEEQELMKRK